MKTNNILAATIILLLLSVSVQAQIDGTFKGANNTRFILAAYRGDKLIPIDTVKSNNVGNITFSTTNMKPGQYRIAFGQGQGTDLLFTSTPVKFTANRLADSVQFSDTLNLEYQELIQKEQIHQQKMELLEKLLDEYPTNDQFYQKVMAQYVKEQIDQSTFVSGMMRRHHTDILGKIALLMKKPFVAPEKGMMVRAAFMRNHFWDLTDMDDTLLMSTNIYPHKAIAYLTLYSNPEFTKDELQGSFIQGIEALLPHISGNQKVFNFVMEYLIVGFEQFGFEDVIQYLATVYQDESCSDAEVRSKLAGKAEIIKRMAIGNPAPPLEGTTPDGKTITISQLTKPNTLVIFWASWCQHCTELLPQISKIMSTIDQQKIDIVAFSLDKNANEWEKAIAENSHNAINISELKGWDSQAANDWGVFATPTLFLLSQGHVITAKPFNMNELTEELKKLNIIEP